MIDGSSLAGLSFIVTSCFVLSLFASWYGRHPTVSQMLLLLAVIAHQDGGLDTIPTVGFPDSILSYLSTLRFNSMAFPCLNMSINKYMI
jgi:hypothetical protein